MSQFVTVIIRDLTCVLLLLFFLSFLVSDLGRVNSDGRDGRIPRFPGVPSVLMLFLLLILPSLIRRLKLRGGSESLKSLGVFSVMYRSLGLNFVYNCVSGSTSSEDLYVSLSYVGT